MCGGYDYDDGLIDVCFQYNPSTSTCILQCDKKVKQRSCFLIPGTDVWTESGNMSTANGEAGCALSIEHGLVTAGGTNGTDILGTNAVTKTQDGEIFEDLPPMPVAKVEHCLVALDGGDLFVTGGLSPLPSEKTYIFSSTSRHWIEVPDMPTGRYTLMCGLIKTGGHQEVVAAGGFYFQYFDTVEIYSVNDNLWRTGKFK